MFLSLYVVQLLARPMVPTAPQVDVNVEDNQVLAGGEAAKQHEVEQERRNESREHRKEKKLKRTGRHATYRNRMKYGVGFRLRDPEKSGSSGSSEDE